MKFKIDHIGYVVKDLLKSKNYFTKNYNFKPLTKIIYEKPHGVKLMFLDMGTKTVPALEIIQPLNKKSKVYNFLMNIEKSLNYLKKKKFLQISGVVPGAGHNFSKTIWLLGKKMELVELVEKQKNKKPSSRFTK